ncbi:MAG: hypothetical protein EXX96DRAFT_555431 [Benjaminiella poitrasii]|nr:MAG: hypothetical protein EXX96DRAFT_555431 [Benjaminiella poitrasii]
MLTLFRNVLKRNDIEQLTTRLGFLQLASIHHSRSQPNYQTDTNTTTTDENLLPVERLRREALKIEAPASLRPRCRWSKEEDAKLFKLVEQYGKRWTMISQEFIDRSPSNVVNRYNLLTSHDTRGPWTKPELNKLRELGRGRTFEEVDDWDAIQQQLVRLRPMFMIKQTYKHSLDPRLKHGRWSEEETVRLEQLVEHYGEDKMELVAQLMGSRTKRQCLERWRWQMSDIRKGRFSEHENRLIADAVQRYGENFAVICKVTGINRTPRHVSQHYQNVLAPGVDRSPWTEQEEIKLYEVCVANDRNMKKTKEALKTNRSVRDLWNHFLSQERKIIKNQNKTK